MSSGKIDFKDVSVLLVDDEPFIRKLVRRIIADIGCTDIKQATDGADALRHLRDGAENIDLVVLDLNMPIIDGFQCLNFMRKDPDSTCKDTPVVVLSGHSEVSNVIRAAEIGIHGFAVKPVSKTALEKQMVRALTEAPIDAARLKKQLPDG